MVSQRLFPYIAGAEVQALGLARALADLGAQVRIVTTRLEHRLPGFETIDGVEIRRLPVTPRPLGSGEADPGAHVAKVLQISAMALYVSARARRYDVVHAHCLSASALGATLGARLAGVPVVIKPSLGGSDGELHKLLASSAAPALLPILRSVSRFAVMSPSIGDELAAVGVSRDRLVAVSNGVDLARFRPADAEHQYATRVRFELPPEGPVALFVGQLVERKGVRPLLEAWSRVRGELEGATLVFVGHGPEAGAVEAVASDSRARVRFLGARNDVVEIMQAADALVLPSRNESFGNVMVEAMACGLPLVVGRTGVAEALDLDGVAGRIVAPDDPESIARALVEVLGAPDVAAALGARGREIARQFDFTEIAGRYLEIYEGMLRQRT